ncbi:MAG: arginine-ornithine antiporter [Candidatus Auribacterota bacterium]|nr:arginine-ornithine antiporter [Candidatus Auribacterota bacterium]
MAENNNGKLGLGALIAIVVGSMIGGGVFSLPQNIASGAAPGAVIIGWIITGIGMIGLAFVYQNLSMRKPELNAGVFSYAKAGFGDFIGFTSAWGYWLSALLGNVSYAVVFFSAMSFFFPIFGSGNNWQSILVASILLWLIHALILKGVEEAAIINVITTIAKLVPIFVFITAVIIAFNLKTFNLDFWGSGSLKLGSVLKQVKNTMLVTLWVFIGIEGAIVVSARARKRSDIGRATIIGLLGALTIYIMVTLLSFGIMSQPELAGLKNPSMAEVLKVAVGPWGAIVIAAGLLISIAGAFLAWTLLAAEIAYSAASSGDFPSFFAKVNAKGSPSGALWVTNGLVQFFLLVTLVYHAGYLTLLDIATTAILIPYVFSAAYAWKLTITGESYEQNNRGRTRDKVIGIIATVYGCWLVYAAGLSYLLLVAILYVPGIYFYWKAGKEAAKSRIFTGVAKLIAVVLIIIAIIAIVSLITGAVKI